MDSPNTIEHTHANILASALEHQLSWADTYDEVVDQNMVSDTITHVTLNTKNNVVVSLLWDIVLTSINKYHSILFVYKLHSTYYGSVYLQFYIFIYIHAYLT